MPTTPLSPVPVSVLATIDPVLREAALAGLVLGSPGTVALRHDLQHTDGVLRRLVIDATGVIEDVRVEIEHACLSCCVREDALPTLARLAADGRWSAIVMALPTTAEPLSVTRALTAATAPHGELPGCRIATTFAVVDLETLEADLLGETLCSERGQHLADDDERSIGEALASQLEQVDLVVTDGTSATGTGLVDRLRGAGTHRIDGLHTLDAARLGRTRHDPAAAERRANPAGARDTTIATRDAADRSWTLILDSALPFHPERLLENIERLGTGPLRARGVFHVVNRPDSACLWDGAGGQTYIADLGTWDEVAAGASPRTRICVVGAGSPNAAQDLRCRIVEAFSASLVTDSDVADGGLRWLGRDDALAPWLGTRATA